MQTAFLVLLRDSLGQNETVKGKYMVESTCYKSGYLEKYLVLS